MYCQGEVGTVLFSLPFDIGTNAFTYLPNQGGGQSKIILFNIEPGRYGWQAGTLLLSNNLLICWHKMLKSVCSRLPPIETKFQRNEGHCKNLAKSTKITKVIVEILFRSSGTGTEYTFMITSDLVNKIRKSNPHY